MDSKLNATTGQIPVLLTGASSQLGVFVIPRLLAKGFRVLALSRRAAKGAPLGSGNPLWINPDVLSANLGERAPEMLKPIEMLISCGPLDLACAALSACPGLRRVVIFSTTSVFSKASSPVPEESEQIAGLIAQETQLRTLCESRNLALLILRPTLIYGCGLDRNVSLLAGWIQRYRWLPLAGPASGLRQPVHADDLAQAAVAALTIDGPLSLDSPACGGSTLSYRQMVELIFDSFDLPPRVLRLPPWMLFTVVGVVARLPTFKGVNREMVRRQNSDLVFDDAPLREALNYKPRPFRPTAADFEIPPSAKQYQLME